MYTAIATFVFPFRFEQLDSIILRLIFHRGTYNNLFTSTCLLYEARSVRSSVETRLIRD